VSERSTAPYVVSTSQPPADRTTIATLSQHSHSSCCWTRYKRLSSLVKTPKTPSWVKTAGKELSRHGRSGSLNGLVQSWSSESSSVRRRSPSKFIFAPFLSVQCDPELAGLLLVHRRSPTDTHLCTVLQAFLGPQVFFYPQKISCLCPSLQVLQSFFGIVGLLLSTEDLPLKPISAGFASFLGTAGLLLSTEDLLPMPISACLAIL
jgi:hypothetical protein